MSALAIPTSKELEGLAPADRWDLEDAMGRAQTTLRDFNDDELRRWVEVEGKTQTEIGEIVGRDQSTISDRCQAAGIEIPKGKGTLGGRPKKVRPKGVMGAHNPTEPEVIEAEVVEEPDPGPRVECPTCGHMVKPGDIQAH